MKIQFRDIERFVAAPDKAARVVLVYGPDAGLIAARAKIIGQSVVKDINDPFNVAVLNGPQLIEDPARLSDEAMAVSMMGGDRLVRIEDASDKISKLLEGYLKAPSPSTLVLVMAGNLGKESSLRKLCEKLPNAAALPCYVDDERSLPRVIRDFFQGQNMRIDGDAVVWLAANISGDRLKVNSELEKLAIYKGSESSPVSVVDAQAACGEAGAQSFDDLVFAVGSRRADAALKAYHVLTDEGIPFVAVLRSLQNHFRRLHMTKARMAEGDNAVVAMKSLAPPVFFKYEDAFRGQLDSWSLEGLSQVMMRLSALEAQCKQTGAVPETLCGQAILGISKSRVA